MPVYEYRCTDCGDVFSELMNISDSDPVVCTKCGSNDIKKLISKFNSPASINQIPSSKDCAPTGGG